MAARSHSTSTSVEGAVVGKDPADSRGEEVKGKISEKVVYFVFWPSMEVLSR
jgi:hypothetical protein